MAWIIRPLPMIAEGWQKLIEADSLRVATFPPIMLFGDGSTRYIVGPGNLVDVAFDGNLLFDVRSVLIVPAVQTDAARPEIVEVYPEPEAEAVQTANQTPAPSSDQTPVRRKKRTGKRGKDKDGVQTAFNHLTEHGDKFSVRGLASAVGVTPYAADKAIHDYRAFISQTKAGGLKQ